MSITKKIALILLCFTLLSSFLNADLIYFANIDKQYTGFVAKSGDNYYAYTSQTALISLFGKFAIKTSDGARVKTAGPLELSYYSDIARLKIEPGEFKDNAFEIGKSVSIGDEVSVYSISMNDNVDTQSTIKIDGVGMYAFAISKETDADSAGSPVLTKDGKVVGVLSKGAFNFVISKGWGEEKIKVVETKNKLAARLDVTVRWVSAKKADFKHFSQEAGKATKLQQEFLPLLNFWCHNPYRELEEDIEYPRKLKTWVKDHNYKTKAYDKLVPKCRDKPYTKIGLINSLMQGTLERAIKLSKFPQNKVRQMSVKWKTAYLRSRASHYLKNWIRVNKMMRCRILNMQYLLPYSFAKWETEEKK